MKSPSRLSQRSTVPSVTDSPSCGILTGVKPMDRDLLWFRRQLEREGGGDAQNRTGDGGFADLCLATWLRRLNRNIVVVGLWRLLQRILGSLLDPGGGRA